jgi:hypothetical protein
MEKRVSPVSLERPERMDCRDRKEIRDKMAARDLRALQVPLVWVG